MFSVSINIVSLILFVYICLREYLWFRNHLPHELRVGDDSLIHLRKFSLVSELIE